MFSLLTTRWSRRWTADAADAEATPNHVSATLPVRDERADFSSQHSRAWALARRGRPMLYGVTLAAASVVACASTPQQPIPGMTRAEDAIEQARRAGADQLANQPLQEAQTQLAHAREAVLRHDGVQAARLADEAYADARLAELTAQNATATKQAAEVDKSIHALENETTRTTTP